MLSHVPLLGIPLTVVCLAPLSMEFSMQEYWGGLPFPPGDLPDPGIEPTSPALQADSLPFEPPGKPVNTPNCLQTGLRATVSYKRIHSSQQSLHGTVSHRCLRMLLSLPCVLNMNPSAPGVRSHLCAFSSSRNLWETAHTLTSFRRPQLKK